VLFVRSLTCLPTKPDRGQRVGVSCPGYPSRVEERMSQLQQQTDPASQNMFRCNHVRMYAVYALCRHYGPPHKPNCARASRSTNQVLCPRLT
jgi:hypothetical protein